MLNCLAVRSQPSTQSALATSAMCALCQTIKRQVSSGTLCAEPTMLIVQ